MFKPMQEMSVMKQVVLNMSESGGNNLKTSRSVRYSPPAQRRTVKSVSGIKKTSSSAPRLPTTFEPAERDENVHKPEPTQFVR